ncbi:F-box domain-containing protein [Mycena sanguinolenta]|uniref:F-box domain-containing protein n=1 Tax=Mycena sanguinolenta TaxID=230812 RepID=A0A8H6ZKF9_9AGAR|nr:F-box domain-containing protein [Mycena sanguinolenta]
MATTPSPRIPLELCEEVIECLPVKNDPDVDVEEQDRYFTLRQCALVCRTWLPLARSRIFRVVHLSYNKGTQLLELLNLNPTLSQYMTIIVVTGPGRLGGCPLELVAELAPKLTATKTLKIIGGALYHDTWMSDWELESFLKLQEAILPILAAPLLTTVALQNILTTEDDFLKLISIPPLVTLRLENIRLISKAVQGRDESVPPTEHRLAISALGLHSQDATLAGWLFRPSCPLHVAALRELSIGVQDIGNIHDFLPLLNAIGSSLKEFGLRLPNRCDFREYRRFSSIFDAIPILPNAHIEHIAVYGFDRRDPSIGSYSKQFDGSELVKCLLLRLSAPQRLRMVTIHENVQILWRNAEEFPKLQWHNWRAVDEVLAQASFSDVKRLDFVAGLNSLGLECETVRSCVSSQFPAFRERKGAVFNLTVDYTSLAWDRAQAARDEMYYNDVSGEASD